MKKKIIDYLNSKNGWRSNLDSVFALFPGSSELEILSVIEELRDKGLVNLSEENQSVELSTVRIPSLEGIEIPVCHTAAKIVEWGYKARDRQLYVSKYNDGGFEMCLHFYADKKKIQTNDEIMNISEHFKEASVPSITLVAQLDSNGNFTSMRFFRGTVIDAPTEDDEKIKETEKNIVELGELGFDKKLNNNGEVVTSASEIVFGEEKHADVDFNLGMMTREKPKEETSYIMQMAIEKYMYDYIRENYGIKRNMSNNIVPERRKMDEKNLNNNKK
jgi:hypothetical protein